MLDEFAELGPDSLVKPGGKLTSQLVDGDQFDHIGQVAVSSPEISQAARELGFNQPCQGQNPQSLDFGGDPLEGGIGQYDPQRTVVTSRLIGDQELHRDTIHTDELAPLFIRGEAGIQQQLLHRRTLFPLDQQIHIDRVALVAMQ